MVSGEELKLTIWSSTIQVTGGPVRGEGGSESLLGKSRSRDWEDKLEVTSVNDVFEKLC